MPEPHWSSPFSHQGKTIIQAEIDAAAELIDFFRFNAKYAMELEKEQLISVPVSTNSMVYRGLEVRSRGTDFHRGGASRVSPLGSGWWLCWRVG